MSLSAVGRSAEVGSAARPWLVVLGSTLALAVGNGPIILFTFGVLVGPITSEFGWSRSTLASAVFASHLAGALALPFAGGLMDRFGVQRVTLPAIGAFALILAGIAFLPPVPALFVLAYAVMGVVGAGHSTLTYARAVSSWFTDRRGMALGITLSGVGLGTALTPQITQALVAHYGWRGAYIGLALVLFVIAAPAVALFVRDGQKTPLMDEASPALPGETLRGAFARSEFWLIAAALLLVSTTVNGSVAHIVPMLKGRGVSAQVATATMSVSGLALIFGRILSGWCLDRFFAPIVSVFCFCLPLIGVLTLASGATGGLAMLAAILLGLGLGAEVDIMAFLVGRYFGLQNYGAIYGTILAVFTFGSGLGPWLIALSFDATGAYTSALIGCGICLVVAGGLILRLGPYRYR